MGLFASRRAGYGDVLAAMLAGAGWFALRQYGFGARWEFSERLFWHFIVLAPLAEELFFRGLIQDVLRKYVRWRWRFVSGTNVVTSVLFSFAHLAGGSAVHAGLVFIPSLIFGGVYDRHRTVIPCIILHAFYNINVFLISG